MSKIPTAVPKQSPEISKRDTLLRLKRQLALENELSSAADESENLGIEQVSSKFEKLSKFEINYGITIYYYKGVRS